MSSSRAPRLLATFAATIVLLATALLVARREPAGASTREASTREKLEQGTDRGEERSGAHAAAVPAQAQEAENAWPGPRREFRAAWVATVANIDWPSKPGLAVSEQQREAIAILDRLVELGMNAVIFQVRPQADALYASRLEPWSAYLTGQQGRAPEPFYDPLEFWVAEAHARGLELHAWLNPYRAWHKECPGEPSSDSVLVQHPERVVRLGKQGYCWMDPAQQEVQQHALAVVRDIVDRYEVDGIHFDDYFYPYRDYNDGKDFPDAGTYAKYRAQGGGLGLHDFRRDAVDRFVKVVYATLRKAPRRVRFGISPFGIWRPGHPRGIEGFDQYAELFADPKRWLEDGDLDYIAPQLYWPIAQGPQSFPLLLGWWKERNVKGRHLWPGISLRKPKDIEGARETSGQVYVMRGMLGDGGGVCIFSMKSLMNPTLAVAPELEKGAFRDPALVPALSDVAAAPCAPPRAQVRRDGERASLVFEVDESGAKNGGAARFVVYLETAKGLRHRILGPAQRSLALDPDVLRVAVTSVDRFGCESRVQVLTVGS